MTAPTTPPPLTARRWLAGLIEITASILEHVGYVFAHIGDGAQAIADHLDPRPPTPDADTDDGDPRPPAPTWARVIDGDHIHYVPLGDAIDHDRSDDCACGPSMRCEQTGRGDVWHIRHHRLTPEGA